MTDPDAPNELLTFFKALADETRLKIVGVLAQKPCSGEELAAIVELKPATITHHLQKLEGAGLVSVEPQGHTKIYRLRMESIHALAERLLAEEPVTDTSPAQPNSALTQAADNLDLDAFGSKVLKDFLQRDGSLKEIPAQYKKQQAVLRHIVKEFAPEQQYTEKQVNEIIARFHPDTASLRRAMIDHKLMQRANGKYWRL